MAWGIVASGFTLFGMLVLAVLSVRMDDVGAGPTCQERPGPADTPPAMPESRSGEKTFKAAA